jgi:HEAT repeat protein
METTHDEVMDGHATRVAARRRDPRPAAEIVDVALWAADENESWEAIYTLQSRASADDLAAALRLCTSPCVRERVFAARILGQFGSEGAYAAECVENLIGLLRPDEDAEVLTAAGLALGHRDDARAIEPLLALRRHPSEDVRYAVVHGLIPTEDPRSIAALIELSADSDEDVRNWATFGLGSQTEVDTPTLREALAARLDEEDHEIRGEALVGLARRRDERVCERLVAELSGDFIGVLALEAAEILADPRLCKLLEACGPFEDDCLRAVWDGAVRACSAV